MNLNGQTILVTGAAGSIGSYIAAELAKFPCKVIGIDLNAEKLEALTKVNPSIKTFVCDLTNEQIVTEVMAEIFNTYKVSVLINLAGYIHSEPLVNLLKKEQGHHSFQSWNQTIQANLSGSFYISTLVAEHMVRGRIKGLIINTSSIAAGGNAGQSAYAAAKAGIEALTKVWAKELGMFKIRCNCIAPGFIDTPSTQQSLSETTIDKVKKMTPAGRLGTPAEFFSAVMFMMENDFFNGKILSLDGGITI
jgi:3-oxoacyl-[acyl-carrier protein] reductase